jgi:hypothetical protein
MDGHEFLQLILDRTEQGTLGWYHVDGGYKCEAAGVAFHITWRANGGYDDKITLAIYDGSVVLAKHNTDATYAVRRIKDAAVKFAEKRALKRLDEVISFLKLEKPIDDTTELTRDV